MHDMRSLFEDHLMGLRRYARSLVNCAGDSDDLVQECILRVLSSPHLWPNVRNVRAYLFTTLHHAHADYRSDQRKRLSAALPEQIEYQIPIQGNQYACLELRDMTRALTSLSKGQRDVVLLIGLEGLSYEEVAQRLSIPIGTVMSRLFRARDMLRYLMVGQIKSSRPKGECTKKFAPT